jgi:hypothetical protein
MTTVSPSNFRTIASPASPGGAGTVTSGKADGWIKIQSLTQTSSVEYSVFLNQTASPSYSLNSATPNPTRKPIQVQDSGVALSSFTSHSSVQSQQVQKSSAPVSKLIPPSSHETIDDDWEVLYPDS